MTRVKASEEKGLRIFFIVWATQSISVFGSALSFFAFLIWLTQTQYPLPQQKQALALALAAISLAKGIPTIIGAPIAGAWADRHDRKRTMMAANIANALISGLIALLMGFGLLNLWLLVPLIALYALSGSFHSAAFDTSYATLVPRRFLPRANGLMQTMWSLSGILAPTIAAGIIAFFDSTGGGFLGGVANGATVAIAIDAVTFLAVGLILLGLTIPSPKRTDLYDTEGKPKKNIWQDMGEGFAYIRRNRAFLWLLSIFTIANFVVSTRSVFQPLIVKETLAADWARQGLTFETALAILSTINSIGGLIGGICISIWGGLKRRRIYGVLVPMILFSCFQVGYGVSRSLTLTAAMAACSAMMIPILNGHSQSIWQEHTPKEFQGRVFSLRRLIAQGTVPLGTFTAGLVASTFDPGAIMAVCGVLLILFCGTQVVNPALLGLEPRHDPDPTVALGDSQQPKPGAP